VISQRLHRALKSSSTVGYLKGYNSNEFGQQLLGGGI
jgi:hypothetical protein